MASVTASARPVATPVPIAASSRDEDVHGVAVRFVDATDRDLAVVRSRLDALRAAGSHGRPHVSVRFVDDVERSGPLHYVDRDRLAYAADTWLPVVGGRRREVVAAVRLPAPGAPVVIRCRHGSAIPLLPELVEAELLRDGTVPLHAAALVHRGRGVLLAGWAGGVKTTTVLAATARGAEYVADDRVHLRPADHKLLGLGEPVVLRARHRRGRRDLSLRDRAFLGAFSLASRLPPRSRLGRRLGEIGVELPAAAVFARRSVETRLDVAVLAVPGREPGARLEHVEPGWLADRLAVLAEGEGQRLARAALALRFAFPGRETPLDSVVRADARETLEATLATCDTYALHYGAECSGEALVDALEQW
jgi:hypothetical protein